MLSGGKQHFYERQILAIFEGKNCLIYLTVRSMQVNKWFHQLVTTFKNEQTWNNTNEKYNYPGMLSGL